MNLLSLNGILDYIYMGTHPIVRWPINRLILLNIEYNNKIVKVAREKWKEKIENIGGDLAYLK